MLEIFTTYANLEAITVINTIVYFRKEILGQESFFSHRVIKMFYPFTNEATKA